MLPAFRLLASALPVALLLAAAAVAQTVSPLSPEQQRALRHSSPQWIAVEGHLPNLESATPAALQMEGDVLRARRLPEDAIDFYQAAMRRGGDQAGLLLRLGVTELELHNITAAQIYFRRVTRLDRRNGEAWNNLGASEYLTQNYAEAISDYRRAIKLNKKVASFHSNLGTVYFAHKDFESARKQFDEALRIDPQLFERETGSGMIAHVLSPEDRARFCFEMAKLALRRQGEQGMLYWLAKASEAGSDLQGEMAGDMTLSAFRKDPRVLTLIANERALRGPQVAVRRPVPALPPASPGR